MQEKQSFDQYKKMTGTPIARLVLTLAVPAVISMLVTNVYNLVDTAFVGRLGTSASGAVGVVFGFMSVIQAFGFMFGQGAGSILSRALGKKDGESASLHASVGFFSSFALGLLITVFGFVFLDDIVYVLGSTETIAPYAKTYISYILVAAPFMCSCLTLNNLLLLIHRIPLVGPIFSGLIATGIGVVLIFFGLWVWVNYIFIALRCIGGSNA